MRLLLLRRAARFSARTALAALFAAAAGAYGTPLQAAPEPLVSLARTVPAAPVMHGARDMGRLLAGTAVPLALSLPLRNDADLQTLLARLYDPNDALYHHWLTQTQFAAQFGPTPQDYDAVIAYARAQGLTVVHTYPSRSLLDVSGTREAVEAAFHTRLESFAMPGGRSAHANMVAPSVPRAMASRIAGIVGLNTAALYRHTNYHVLPRPSTPLRPMIAADPQATPRIGTGPVGGLAPADIKTAYSLTSIAPINLSGLTGQGQPIGLYELDGFARTDIQAYATQFNLPTPNLQTILFGGFNGAAGINSLEVVLDIDMLIALAPNANIYVYEAKNGTAFEISLYQKIADDNIAKSVSTSFGLTEVDAQLNGEIPADTQAFKQMAAQGQSIFAASGDAGAYDDGKVLSVDSPASNPFMTGVGGTTLSINSQQAYASESAWSDPTDPRFAPHGSGGGGGISILHTIPDYQVGINGASAGARNVPDVSLNADFNTGYDISQGGRFITVGGTSAAAPLWAAFTGLVNERRANFGLTSTVGFLNPVLYNIYRTGNYASVFHDVSDGSTNLYYAAKKGYDNATGLGTFIGDQLCGDLSPNTSNPVTLTGTVTDLSTGQPATGATVTITCLQVPGFQASPVATSGTFTITLGSLIMPNTTTGKKIPLIYSVAADQAGRAGDTQNVTLTLQNTVALNISTPDHTFSSGTLQMVSAPYDYTSTGDFTALFGLTPPLNGTGVNFIVYSPLVSRYLYYPSAPADTFHLGQGYWAAFPSNAYIQRRGKPAPAGSFRITLQSGWNQIGDPFTHAVTVSGIQVEALGASASATNTTPIAQSSLVAFPLYGYTPPTITSANGYYKVDTSGLLQPWQGYWIYAYSPAVLILPGS